MKHIIAMNCRINQLDDIEGFEKLKMELEDIE